ncbi:hypothetical protein BGW80DRAFT_1442528 [Lactifluus volemus]|nr:hypothetical protein BGW80DRAFT_1442528 [Lactifluus volemus]
MLREVPGDIKHKRYPSMDLSIESFIKYQLPKCTYALPGVEALECFKKREPNADLDAHTTIPLPSRQFVEKLDTHFRQAILDDMHSVINPAYPGSYLPLWLARYWKDMWEIYNLQETWKKGLTWLEDKMQGGVSEMEYDIYRGAHKLTNILRWSEETNIAGAHGATDIFARYLSDKTWMNSTQINMMFAHILDRIEQDETLDSLVTVETLCLWTEIKKAKNIQYFDGHPPMFLHRLEKRILDREIDFLIFPVHWDVQKHWLTFKLDFQLKELSYSDSLAHKLAPPMDIIKKLQWWLKKRLDGPFKNLGDGLEHGRQDDMSNCGILCANTAACDIFEDDDLWTTETKALKRGEQ